MIESAVRYPSQALGSGRGESEVLTRNLDPASVYSTVLACCFKRKTKKQNKNTAVVQREESSHWETVVNAARFSSSEMKKRDEEEGAGKAGSQESRDRIGGNRKILQENKLGSVPVH